jgi:precorrin-6A/cobalt-precorrin-6A reductase
MRILILGGTFEARGLAERLAARGHEVITSLAGRTSDPLLPDGATRIGGFGGIPGLVAYLTENHINYLIDATHPYAGLISINAQAAASRSEIPLLRLMRAPWVEPPGTRWIHMADLAGAATALPAGAHAFLTTGQHAIDIALRRDDCTFLIRLIERPEVPVPANATIMYDRPPFSVEGELALFRRHHITHLVTKNSGGNQTSAKLEAARQLGIPVIMVARPGYSPAREVATIEDALAVIQKASP